MTLVLSSIEIQASGLLKSSVKDEKVLKDRIVARYGFIDQAEDSKEFRPPPLKTVSGNTWYSSWCNFKLGLHFEWCFQTKNIIDIRYCMNIK